VEPGGRALHELLNSELATAYRHLRDADTYDEVARQQGRVHALEQMLKYLTEPLPDPS
jgi:hypothetical protein